MKLHLTLTLRRAVLAAMATLALGSTQAADITYANGDADAYITGTGMLAPNEWNAIWKKAGSLTIGNYQGNADVSLNGSANYNNGKTIFIGGTGHNSKEETANDGKLNVGSSKLNVNSSLYVGYSLVGGTGELTIDGGTVHVGDRLYVGGYEGQGIIDARNATITVTGGSDDPKYDNVFAMGFRNSNQEGTDLVSLSNSKLTVGAAGGKIDVSTIGRGGGNATLWLSDGSVATFHDQTIVGEKSGSNGMIYVNSGTTLNLGSSTILGHEQGAEGYIYVEGTVNAAKGSIMLGDSGQGSIELTKEGKLSAANIILGGAATGSGSMTMDASATATVSSLHIGTKGKGNVELKDTAALTATKQIVVGTNAGKLEQTLVTAAGTKLTTPLLTIGDTNTGSAAIGGKLVANTVQLGRTTTGKGTLTIEDTAEVDTLSNLVVGYEGTGILTTYADLTATNTTVAGTSSKLNIEGGTTKLTNASILGGAINNNAKLESGNTIIIGGAINTAAGAETSIESILLASGGTLSNAGNTSVAEAAVGEGSSIQATGGNLEITTALTNSGKITIDNAAALLTETSLTNNGTITNNGSWYLDGEATSSVGTIVNNGAMIVKEDAELATSSVAGTGSVTLGSDSAWLITGQTTQGTIANEEGAITIQGAGRVEATSLTGSSVANIMVDKTSVSTAEGDAVISVTNPVENTIGVKVDVTDASALVGKKIDFVKVGDNLTAIEHKNIGLSNKDTSFEWNDDYIKLGESTRTNSVTGADGSITTTTTTITEKINFAESAGSTADATTGLKFLRYEMAEATDVSVDWSGVAKVEIEVKSEILETAQQQIEENKIAKVEQEKIVIPDDATEDKKAEIEAQNAIIEAQNAANAAAKEFIAEAGTVQKVELNSGYVTVTDETTGTTTTEEKKTQVVIAKDVTTEGTGTMQVQSVVVNQVTKFNDPTVEDKKETIAVSGIGIVFEGETKHNGKTDNDGNKLQGGEIGFAKDTQTGTVKLENEETSALEETEVKKVDIVQVKESAKVEISNLDMHATHSLTIGAEGSEGKTSLVLDNVTMHVGGETDVNVLHMVEVSKYNDKGEKIGSELKPVESEAHLTTKNVIANSEVTLLGASVIKFEEIDFGKTDEQLAGSGMNREEIEKLHGTTEIKNSHIVLSGGEAQLGENNYTDDKGTEHKYQTIKLTNSSIKGSGHVKNVHLDAGSTLTVGSSPGVVKASNLTNNGTTTFYFITTSNEWQNHNNGAGITATEGTGAISQLYVDASVTLNGAVTFVYQEWNGSEFVNCTDQQAARKLIGSYITEDTVITFVTGNTSQLTLAESFDILEETLPILQDGMEWNLAEMLTAGTATVISEKLEEPYRIANTLVSAGETVLNFGRLAGSQAMLRKAGTTRTWASAIANFDSVKGGTTANGYDSDTWGAAVGVDHAFAKNTVMGVALARTYGENTPKTGTDFYDAGSIDQDATMVGLYGTHKFRTKGLMNDVKLNAFAAYGWFENESSRNSLKKAHNATAEWDSNAWVLSASLSRDITSDDGLVVSPYVGVEYTKASMDTFTEKGRTYSAEYTADQDYSNLSVKVGVNVSKTIGSFTPYAGIAYINDVSRDTPKVTASGKRDTITGKAAMPGRSAVQLKVGASVQLTEGWELNASYNAELRDDATEHNANVGVGYTF